MTPLPFQLLQNGELDLVPVASGLVRLVAESLGLAATPADGTGELLAEAATQFAAGRATVQQLDQLLRAHFAPIVEETGSRLVADTAALEKNVAEGKAILREIGGLIPNEAVPGAAVAGGGAESRADLELLAGRAGRGRF